MFTVWSANVTGSHRMKQKMYDWKWLYDFLWQIYQQSQAKVVELTFDFFWREWNKIVCFSFDIINNQFGIIKFCKCKVK